MKKDYKGITPFRRCVLQNFPFIEQDFDALNNYGLLCKVVEYLNKVIDSQNEVSEEVSNLNTAFTQLKNYVDNYFDNLDVQDEINNKLDQMAQDGSLEVIMQKILGEYSVYNFHTVMATKYYRSSDPLRGMQGGCVLPNGTIFQCTGELTNKIIIYSQDGTTLNSKDVNYGHCNAVTYNSKKNRVIITSTQSTAIGRYKVYEINPDTLEEVSVTDCADKDFPGEPYGIAYVEEDDSYVFVNYWRTTGNKYLWKTDTDYNVIKTKTIDVEVRSTSNIGRFDKYLGVNTISDDMVMLFNLYTLDFVREVRLNKVISDVWNLTEVEWFDTRNGKIYLGFTPGCATSPTTWGKGTKVYAVFDPTINYSETRKSNTEFSPSGEIYYVNNTSTYNPLRDGSQTAPFENIYEALNSALRTENITGSVTINITGNAEETFYPFFSMNKSYKVLLLTGDNDHLTMSGMYVAQGAEVVVSKNVKLNADGGTYEDCNVYNRGRLFIDGNLTMSDNSKVIIKGTNGSKMTCRFEGGGYDLSEFYGKLTNINNQFVSTNDFLTVRALTPSSQMTTKIIGYRETLTQTSDQTYQVPSLSPIVYVTVRCDLPNGNAGTTTTVENTFPYVTGLYTNQSFTYMDTDSTIKMLRCVVEANGTVKFFTKPLAGLTNLRVKVCTGE